MVGILIAFPQLVTVFLDKASVQDLNKIEINIPGDDGSGGGLDLPPVIEPAPPPGTSN
jgi:hypothetical protein